MVPRSLVSFRSVHVAQCIFWRLFTIFRQVDSKSLFKFLFPDDFIIKTCYQCLLLIGILETFRLQTFCLPTFHIYRDEIHCNRKCENLQAAFQPRSKSLQRQNTTTSSTATPEPPASKRNNASDG